MHLHINTGDFSILHDLIILYDSPSFLFVKIQIMNRIDF
jgi:hypothetical protein